MTFTATVTPDHAGSGTPTGTVTFKDGSTTLGTGTLSSTGVATFSTSTLSVGSHAITAVYGGDSNFTTSTSPTLTQVVNGTQLDNVGVLLLAPTGPALQVGPRDRYRYREIGAVVVDSGSNPAAVVGGTVTADDIDVTGQTKTTGTGSFSSAVNHEAPIPDPLGLGLPPAPPVVSPSQKWIIGTGNVMLSPGTYVGGIVIAGKGSVTLQPGVYYMQGGGFSAIGQGSITGSGVLIVNGPSKSGQTGSINLVGQGQVTLGASTALTGDYASYNGIAIFQNPHSSAPDQRRGRRIDDYGEDVRPPRATQCNPPPRVRHPRQCG